jgi:hypothetical protein
MTNQLTAERNSPKKGALAIDPYVDDNRGNKSSGYLRHFTHLKEDLLKWNPDITFNKLNELSLNSYLQYLKGEGTPKRAKVLKSATVGHHFKHLRQVAKYAHNPGVKVDPTVNDFKPGKFVYELGCFDLTYDELMILWHYQSTNSLEEAVLDHSLFEALTGVRTGDIRSIKNDGTEHGIKCGDVSVEAIGYRDRKNHDLLKTATRHKFNERLIKKYLIDDSNEFCCRHNAANCQSSD